MNFLMSLKFYTVLLSFLSQVAINEGKLNDIYMDNLDDSNYCLYEDCNFPIHDEILFNPNVLTCAKSDIDMFNDSRPGKSYLSIQTDFRPSCCDPNITIVDVPEVPNPALSYSLPKVDSEQIEDLRRSLQLTRSQKTQIELLLLYKHKQILDDLDTMRMAPTKEVLTRVRTNQILVFDSILYVFTPRQKELFNTHYDDLVSKFSNITEVDEETN